MLVEASHQSYAKAHRFAVKVGDGLDCRAQIETDNKTRKRNMNSNLVEFQL